MIKTAGRVPCRCDGAGVTSSRYVALGLALGWLAGVACSVAVQSRADDVQYEIGVGFAKGKTAPDGIWWEHEFDTDNRVSSPSWSIGKSWKAQSGWGVRADFGQILKFSARNMAVGNERNAAAVAAGQMICNPQTSENCLLKLSGDGEAFGAHIGIFREFNLGRWQVQPEAGILPYYYSWTMRVEHPYDSLPTDHDFKTDTGAGIYLTEYARLTVKRGMFFARVDYDHNAKGHSGVVGIQEGKVIAASLGVSVSF